MPSQNNTLICQTNDADNKAFPFGVTLWLTIGAFWGYVLDTMQYLYSEWKMRFLVTFWHSVETGRLSQVEFCANYNSNNSGVSRHICLLYIAIMMCMWKRSLLHYFLAILSLVYWIPELPRSKYLVEEAGINLHEHQSCIVIDPKERDEHSMKRKESVIVRHIALPCIRTLGKGTLLLMRLEAC